MRGAYNLVVVVSGTFGAAIDNTHTYATMWANEIERDEEPNIFVNAKLWYSCGHVPCRKVRRACSDSKQLRHLLTPMRRRHIHDSIGTQFHHFQAHEFAWIFFFFQSARCGTSIETQTARSKLIEMYFSLFGVQLSNIHPMKAYLMLYSETLRCR